MTENGDPTTRHGTFRIAGIPIVLPWSSLIGVALLTWLFAPGFSTAADPGERGYALAGVFAVLVYASILVHELAHAGAARAFRYPVYEIRLYALGGYTSYERRVGLPGSELLIALAGPASTLVLAAACWGAGTSMSGVLPTGSIVTEMLLQLGFVGLALGVYNLLPGLPLDGGSLVKCAVWKATGSEPLGMRVAAYTGFMVAAAVFAVPFYLSFRAGREAPDLTSVVAIALFSSWLGMGALDALRRSKVQQRLPTISARLLARRTLGVARDLPLAEALRRLAESGAGAMVVLDPAGRPMAIANEASISAVPETRRPWVTVASVSRSVEGHQSVPADLGGEDLLDFLREHPAAEHLVVDDDGGLVGVLTTGDVQAALSAP